MLSELESRYFAIKQKQEVFFATVGKKAFNALIKVGSAHFVNGNKTKLFKREENRKEQSQFLP